MSLHQMKWNLPEGHASLLQESCCVALPVHGPVLSMQVRLLDLTPAPHVREHVDQELHLLHSLLSGKEEREKEREREKEKERCI